MIDLPVQRREACDKACNGILHRLRNLTGFAGNGCNCADRCCDFRGTRCGGVDVGGDFTGCRALLGHRVRNCCGNGIDGQDGFRNGCNGLLRAGGGQLHCPDLGSDFVRGTSSLGREVFHF